MKSSARPTQQRVAWCDGRHAGRGPAEGAGRGSRRPAAPGAAPARGRGALVVVARARLLAWPPRAQRPPSSREIEAGASGGSIPPAGTAGPRCSLARESSAGSARFPGRRLAQAAGFGRGTRHSMTEVLPYDRARESCARAIAAELDEPLPASMDADAAARFAEALDVQDVRTKGASLANDANATGVDAPFASVDAEAALIVVMHALDFGGGWRLALHAYHGKGAWQTVKPGIEALYAAAPTLPTAWLASRTAADIQTLFGIVGDTPEALALAPFVAQLTAVTNELGEAIGAAGCSTVAEWLTSRMEAASGPGSTPAAALVGDLVSTFPRTFDDRYILRDGTSERMEVALFKKVSLNITPF